MTLRDHFLAESSDPLHGPLLALWWDGHGDWERAHAVAQEIDDADGSWVHAYLHRKEGDTTNAGYWYRRAGRKPFIGSVDREWALMVEELRQRR